MGKAKPAEQPAKPAASDTVAAPGATAQPDERDAAIARLERAVAEERGNAAALREANNALTFKLEIMEKGYSKQLADARKKMESAVEELTGYKTQLAELGTGGEETRRMLQEARAELNRAKADRSLLKEQLSRGGAKAGVVLGDDGSDGSQTINALITSASLQSGRDRAGSSDSNQSQRVRAEESPSMEMLSPDLIFTKSDKDD
jgi:chromosome segregation ATPase